jgi:hypothetical protein
MSPPLFDGLGQPINASPNGWAKICWSFKPAAHIIDSNWQWYCRLLWYNNKDSVKTVNQIPITNDSVVIDSLWGNVYTRSADTVYYYLVVNRLNHFPVVRDTSDTCRAVIRYESTGLIESRPRLTDGFYAYPNPCSGRLFIEPDKNSGLGIYDVQGRLIRKIATGRHLLTENLSGYPNGVYLIKAGMGSKSIIKRILLEK